MYAFASMAAGGVLERHPRLRCAFLEGTVRVAAVVAVAPGRGVGEVRPRLRDPDLAAAEPVLLPAVLHRDRRDEKVLKQVVEDGGRRQHRRLDRLSALRRLLPHAIEEFVGWRA
jgi:hypothetical protein